MANIYGDMGNAYPILFLGGVGLLGGFLGSGKVKITCLKCGHTWKP